MNLTITGPGHNGRCFPKDVQALARTAREHGQTLRVLEAVEAVNHDQKQVLVNKVFAKYGRRLSGNAFALMRRAERFLIDWMPVAGKIVPGQMARIDTPALPVEAVREALANAFIHRDYASAAGSVSVALYNDRLEVISPGELHFGLTPKMLFQPHESKPWNPWIAKVFYRRGLIETWGRGTLKIAALMQEAGLVAPTLKVHNDFVTMTFVLPDAMVRLKKGGTLEETPGKTPGKTPDLILQRLVETPGTSIPELAQHLGKSDRAIERAIRKLRADGKLARIGPAKGGHWEVIQ